MSFPLVSIVLPVFNCRPWLADAIRSVQGQDYPHWELIVVDDGSTDGSHAVVEPFLIDPRIRLIRQLNRGMSAACNTGIRESRGAFVSFLDADDLYLPRAISSRLMAALRFNASVAFSRQLMQIGIDDPVPPAPSSPSCRPAEAYPSERMLALAVGSGLSLPQWAVVISRATLEAAGGFDESINVQSDVELFSRLVRQPALWVEAFEPFYIYRRRPGSLSDVGNRAKAREVLRSYAKVRRNLAPWLEQRPDRLAEGLLIRCVQCWPWWTEEHRAAMREARTLMDGQPIDLTRFVGGPRAQAVARLFGWRAGRTATLLGTWARHRLHATLRRVR